MAVDVSGISGNVYGIVGTGISLGLLSGMAGMTMRAAERISEGGYRRPYHQRSYGRGYRREPFYEEEKEEEIEYRRPLPRTYKRKTTQKKSSSKKRKTYTKRYRRDTYEERPRYGMPSPYTYRTPRLNIPRYW